jgi:adenine/guanine phosphoribosyltransferase-like PRPP-binding protein
LENDISEILFYEEQIKQRIIELGNQLSEDFKDKNPLVICVLKGAFVFMSDLIRNMSIPLEVDFMAVSSYGAASKSSGVVKINKDLDVPVEGRDLIIVEDIADSGLTLNFLQDVLRRKNAKSITVVALFDKPARRKVDIKADYVGFLLPDEFIVGYGLDYAERYRNLPYVGILKREIYSH